MADNSMLYEEEDAPEVSHPILEDVEDTAARRKIDQVKTDAEIGVSDRAGYLGGSDAAVVCGLSPWKTPFELYLEKTGQKEPDDLSENERVQWGTLMEPFIAAEYAKRTGKKLRRVNRLIRDKQFGYLAAHIDRRILNENGVFEAKTVGVNAAKAWGRPAGSGEIAPYYLPQVHHYLMVTGAAFCDVAALIGGNEFRIYTVVRDDEYIGYLRQIELDFWQSVMSETMPEVRTEEDARLAWPTTQHDQEIEGSEASVMSQEQLLRVQANIEDLKEEESSLKALLMAEIGDAGDTLTYEGKKLATWKQQKGKKTVNLAVLLEEYPEAYARCLRTGNPYRVFRLKK